MLPISRLVEQGHEATRTGRSSAHDLCAISQGDEEPTTVTRDRKFCQVSALTALIALLPKLTDRLQETRAVCARSGEGRKCSGKVLAQR